MILFDTAVLFDPAKHQYADADGSTYPSVTTVLKPWSPISKAPERVLEKGRERGELVHLATQYDDEGGVNEEAIGEEIMAYVRAWRMFRAEWDFQPLMIERRFIHRKLGYAGTLDRFGRGRDPRTKRQQAILLDIKSGQPDPTHGPQTAAYAQALDCKVSDLRMTVYLKPDKYEVEKHPSLSDWSTFMAALQWHRWREKHGL